MHRVTIRKAELKDADDIARVRITGWRQSYVGMMPQALLDKLDIKADKKRVVEAMSNPENQSCRFVTEVDGKVVGIAACGPKREAGNAGRAEVYAIYLLDEAKGRGIGKALMQEMATALYAQGFTSLELGVLKENKAARAFYEGLGGKHVHEGAFKYDGFEMPDVVYEWKDIRTLMPPSPPVQKQSPKI